MTKKEKEILNKWDLSSNYSLLDVYKTCSRGKHFAFEKIKQDASTKQNASAVKILGANCNMFSTGFYFEENNKKYFCYDTKDNRKIFEVMEG